MVKKPSKKVAYAACSGGRPPAGGPRRRRGRLPRDGRLHLWLRRLRRLRQRLPV